MLKEGCRVLDASARGVSLQAIEAEAHEEHVGPVLARRWPGILLQQARCLCIARALRQWQVQGCPQAFARPPLLSFALEVWKHVRVALVQMHRDTKDVRVLVEVPGSSVSKVNIQVHHGEPQRRRSPRAEVPDRDRGLVEDAAAVRGVPPSVAIQLFEPLVAAVVVSGRSGQHNGTPHPVVGGGQGGPLRARQHCPYSPAGSGLGAVCEGRRHVAVKPHPAFL
mmetsp:Transcript_157371/g.382199  ORF Transcript_157371/g.382199 Transcript_157371/m.382199 type:complete len:223 (-) Transcript_157371:368-1036(-)